ncbi:MAG: hypothetical protein ACLPV8_01975 [Steroidobacteraceae bacterium]
MSRKPKKPAETPPDFTKGDPDSEGLRRVVMNTIANAPAVEITEMLTSAHHGRAHKAAQQKKSKGPRGADDNGRTLADVVRSITKPHAEPAELWPLMHDALTEWCDDECTLLADPPRYEYTLFRKDKKALTKSLTYRYFCSEVRKIRRGK